MHIVVIGNGIAGTNAARFIRKNSQHTITMVSNETLQPFARTALMYVYMGHMRHEDTHLYEDWFWKKNKIDRIEAQVINLDTQSQTLLLADGQTICYDKLIIASGSKPNKTNIENENIKGVSGLYHLQDLKKIEQYTQNIGQAVVVGGGLIGIELAEMLRSRHIHTTLLVRESSFWNNVLPAQESQMINQHIIEHHIDLRLNTQLKAIVAHENNTLKSIITHTNEEIPCCFLGISIGVSPNIDFLKNSGLLTNKGILVDEYLQTNAPNVFAIGDCAERQNPQTGRKPIEALWYTARMMGQTVAQTIANKKTAYDAGMWFNSAKFLDIEYQVYGQINAKKTEGIEEIFWQHESKKKSVRIAFDASTQAVVGFNLMGIRYRHEVCEQWILDKTPIKTVVNQLEKANFDPEFFKTYEKQIAQQFYNL